MNVIVKSVLAAGIGLTVTFATGMIGIASGMEPTDTFTNIPVKEWIDVVSTSVSAAATTLGAYLLRSPKEKERTYL